HSAGMGSGREPSVPDDSPQKAGMAHAGGDGPGTRSGGAGAGVGLSERGRRAYLQCDRRRRALVLGSRPELRLATGDRRTNGLVPYAIAVLERREALETADHLRTEVRHGI